MKGYVVSKSLQDAEITPQEGMQIYWEGWNTYINSIEGDKAILAQDMFQGLIPISALNTLTVETISRGRTYGSYPLKYSDWQTAIDQELINSGKKVEFNIWNEVDEVARRKALINRNEGENDWEVEYMEVATLVPQQGYKDIKPIVQDPHVHKEFYTEQQKGRLSTDKEFQEEFSNTDKLLEKWAVDHAWDDKYYPDRPYSLAKDALIAGYEIAKTEMQNKIQQKKLLEEIVKESEKMGLYYVKPPELPTDLDSLLHEFSKLQVKKKQQYAEKGIWVTLDNFTDFVDFLQQKRIKVAQREIEALLIECKIQFEYLNDKFGQTGTTNSLLAKIESYLYL